jgi:hypothetical protein
LRALHRKLSPCPPNYRASWPYHSCDRGDAAPLITGQAKEIVVAFLPTAWRFGKASRIRLAIAGADANHYGQVPHDRPPAFLERTAVGLPPNWPVSLLTCMGLFLSSGCFRFIASSLFGAGEAVLHPVACDQVPGARGRGQGTETLA